MCDRRDRFRFTITVDLDPAQADQYRHEHDLPPGAPLRLHIRDLIHTELAGLGAHWWTCRVNGGTR